MPGIGLGLSLAFSKKGPKYGPELHIDANAISDPNGNEANATTGWTGLNGVSFSSVASPVANGNFAFLAESNSTPSAAARIEKVFSTKAGANYLMVWKWRHVGSGGIWANQVNGVGSNSINNTETSYKETSREFVGVGTTTQIRFLESNASNDGGINLDNFSLREILY